MHNLEIPIFGPKTAAQAITAGAHRLELNRTGSYAQGGITPTLDELKDLTPSSVSIPIRIMIRPRGPPPQGVDFIYTPTEIAVMQQDILHFKESGMLDVQRGDGFVFGVLRREGTEGVVVLDEKTCTELVGLARPYRCVLHRASDLLFSGEEEDDRQKLERVMETIVDCGFDGVLTSGGAGDASTSTNLARLGRVVRLAEEDKVEIIVGGGVRSGNISRLVEGVETKTGGWFHSSCLVGGEFDSGEAGRLVGALQAASLSRERSVTHPSEAYNFPPWLQIKRGH
ncbi:copper homeostasis CutC domain-containing protein [Echria macrotheca]|uniref:Copper homeostasis protein cutC homolog n=1 Tax=Echria macrotheca TaxID=438768 RepID=A0AAJ0BPX1_9PEZI|nr:copper homeostasis CutC domain-containing protein [Echria macrotheca]